MKTFKNRWHNAVKKIEDRGAPFVVNQPQNVRNSSAQFKALLNKFESNVSNLQRLRDAFKTSKFAYGTAGPKAMHYGGQGNPLTNFLKKWRDETVKSMIRDKDNDHGRRKKFISDPEFKNFRRAFTPYDTGPRLLTYLRSQCQMMDMYYGIENNDLYTRRNPIIAEFVHYVMDFTPPFDFDKSGRDMYKLTFPGADEGWSRNPDTDRAYGHSATKEMSKIIREGVKAWGGQIIMEGTAIYGTGVFDRKARQGDTDLECQELFKYFHANSGHTVNYGKGTIQFQWRGQPTVPTKAHFLTNWKFHDAGHLHSEYNQLQEAELRRLLTRPHGLRPIWDNFKTLPSNYGCKDEFLSLRLFIKLLSSKRDGFGYGNI